jgi:predicted RNA binding protein YcfA (HicA-like mRNA interferase family)
MERHHSVAYRSTAAHNLPLDRRPTPERTPPPGHVMKFRDFIRILVRNGFALERQSGSSHRVYKGYIDRRTRLVVVACHSENDDIKSGTLSSMIRQSGLAKRMFRP